MGADSGKWECKCKRSQRIERKENDAFLASVGDRELMSELGVKPCGEQLGGMNFRPCWLANMLTEPRFFFPLLFLGPSLCHACCFHVIDISIMIFVK